MPLVLFMCLLLNPILGSSRFWLQDLCGWTRDCSGWGSLLASNIIRLCLDSDLGIQDSHANVWVMREYGRRNLGLSCFVSPHVSREFFFDWIEPLGFTKDGEVIMGLNSERLVLYDLNKNMKIGIPQTCKQFDESCFTSLWWRN